MPLIAGAMPNRGTNRSADLAGSENQYAVHKSPPKRGAFCPRSAPGASGHGGAAGVTRRFLTGGKSVLRSFDMRAPETTSWHSASWQTRPARQQPVYSDPRALERVVAHIARLPPIVVSWEIEALRSRLAAAQRGEAFLLQGGACAEG